MKQALILFAHGSRDAAWAAPFERLRERVAAALPGSEVGIAYLELMRPTLDEALNALEARGMQRVSVVPVFLGQGGHVSEDLPRLLAAAGARHPGLEFAVQPPIGEQPGVIEAIAGAIARRELNR